MPSFHCVPPFMRNIFRIYSRTAIASMLVEPYYDSDSDRADSDDDADSVLDIENQDDADAYVDRIFAIATDAEKDKMRRTYLRSVLQFVEVTENPFGQTPKIGGTAPEMDFRLYKLLEFADSLHDFPNDVHAYVIEKVLHITADDYPYVARVDDTGRVTLEKMTIEDVVTHRQFLTDLTINRVLHFGNSEVDSPLHKLDYRPEMMPHPVWGKKKDEDGNDVDLTAEEYEDLLVGTQKVHDDRIHTPATPFYKCKEVWSKQDQTRAKMRVLKLQQIIDVCDGMREKFKPDACFVMDSNKPLPHLISSYSLIDKSVNKKFRFENEAVPDIVPLLQQMLSKTWENVTCDASLVDGSDHRGVIHRRATGQVFHSESLVKVSLDGCDGINIYRYMAASTSVSDTSRGIEEINVAKTVVDNKWQSATHIFENYSKSEVVAVALSQSAVNVSQNQFVPRPLQDIQFVARWLAMKRAGDWGQIMHCKKYGLVFTTHDKPAFMFAVANDVSSMLFAEDDAYRKTKQLSLSTFVMYSSKESRASLTNVEDLLAAPVPEKPEIYNQTGGARRYGLAIACAAVTLAASLAQGARSL